MAETAPPKESALEKTNETSAQHVEGVHYEEEEFKFTAGKFFALMVRILIISPSYSPGICRNAKLMIAGSSTWLPCSGFQRTDGFAYSNVDQP